MQLAATPEQLQQLGRELAAELPPFTILVLIGDLGAGKTTLMQGVAEGWGVARADQVSSPTYTLVHEYRRPGKLLLHMDLYRIETGAQLETLGMDDLLRPPAPSEAKLVAIEWGEKIEPQLPRPYLRLEILVAADQRREIQADWIGR